MPTLYYKKPSILKNILSFKGHAVIEASAGTGKTYTLEHLVLELLINPPDERKVDIEEILYEELLKFESERGTGMLGSSNK